MFRLNPEERKLSAYPPERYATPTPDSYELTHSELVRAGHKPAVDRLPPIGNDSTAELPLILKNFYPFAR
jgi:hypothetical protein